jgi:hypothetical protein
MSVVTKPPTTPPQADELELLIHEARARQRRRRTTAAAAVGVAAAIGISVWAAVPRGATARVGSRGSSPPLAVPRCSIAQLRISFPFAFAATGHEGGWIRFVDASRERCLLTGWPRVRVVKANGETVRVQRQAVQDMWIPFLGKAARRVPRLILRPGQAAIAEIQDGDIRLGNSAKACPAARLLRVGVPGDRRYVTISARLRREAAYLPLCYPPGVSPIVPAAALPR